jgi:uncharacterized alkaline shock family protein YloU
MTESTPPGASMDDGELINGYSLEELSDYLDSGRSPRNADIEDNPDCRHALDRLERLRELSAELLSEETDAVDTPEESWYQGIMRGISREVRAGRPVPIRHPDPNVDLSVTEGAIRALIRTAGDSVDGAIIGRTQFGGDITVPDAAITVEVDVTAYANTPLRALAERVRAAVGAQLGIHTELNVTNIDITITDVHVPRQHREEGS